MLPAVPKSIRYLTANELLLLIVMISPDVCLLLLTIFTLFPLVFGLGFGGRLPLHVGWGIGASALERHDVVDYIAWATAFR